MTKEFVVFWTAAFRGKNPGYGTKEVHARFKDFDTTERADKHMETLRKAQAGEYPYQSRYVSNVCCNYRPGN